MNGILSLISKLDVVIGILIKPIVIILSASVAVMMAYGVITRAILDQPVFGLEEIVLMCAMWLYMFGAVLASRERSHLTADFIQVVCKNTSVIKFFHLLATMISLAMAVMFSIWAYDLLDWALRKGQSTTVFHLPWYISQSSLFVASVLFIFYLIRDFFEDLNSFLSRKTA
ncbi:TRAP transporter small permease [Marinobacterium lutimaris]|uniref:TRAP transporter small permease protein n=1 Tax=Marinobacterium lutimaris TaxID=568106 RepID=A0A1H5VDE4_9GAMM|nr:TRAP transporter small permease [Marinobacterium lutimaris]SEF85329.1 TRAP-type C4-dicarboxylate transport system, small permease component [Marinobacterium lutimaris]